MSLLLTYICIYIYYHISYSAKRIILDFTQVAIFKFKYWKNIHPRCYKNNNIKYNIREPCASRYNGEPIESPLKPIGAILSCDVRGVSGGLIVLEIPESGGERENNKKISATKTTR